MSFTYVFSPKNGLSMSQASEQLRPQVAGSVWPEHRVYSEFFLNRSLPYHNKLVVFVAARELRREEVECISNLGYHVFRPAGENSCFHCSEFEKLTADVHV